MKIYNTLTRNKEEFKPIKKGKVGIYVCGPTVYDDPHIGHVRSAYVFDVIRRYFMYKGYVVKFVRNVTDVDDKIINKAMSELKGEDLNKAVEKVSAKYLKSYHKYMDALAIMRPDKEPKATEYIKKMKDFIVVLIERGVAYESAGDVYFDVRKASDYGRLSNQSLEMLEAGARVSPGENKKDPLDFALWKKAKEGEPSWSSPWGPGRPGWHIECSVMSLDILGDEFDIHGGGIDLIFPHHENEIAQSEGAGRKFARTWIHNGLLTINKEKMAKSLGNFVTVEEVLKKYPAAALKILFLQSHYSHPVDFSWERMDEAKKAWYRFEILIGKIGNLFAKWDYEENADFNNKIKELESQFNSAMDDDFNTAEALAVLFEMVTYVNKNISDATCGKNNLSKIDKILNKLLSEVFGILSGKRVFSISKEEINNLIKQRNKARKEKDFKTADKVRKDLDKRGIILEDQKDGTTWRAA